MYCSRSGTEEEYTELDRLLEDIITYKRDVESKKEEEKKKRKEKEKKDKEKGLEMRQAALSSMYSK